MLGKDRMTNGNKVTEMEISTEEVEGNSEYSTIKSKVADNLYPRLLKNWHMNAEIQ